jgi:hypothetical protein
MHGSAGSIRKHPMIQILIGKRLWIPAWWHYAAILAGALFCSPASAADTAAVEFAITESGQPKAEIVVEATQPEPPVAFAVQELQRYVREMSSAKLPIVRAPSGKPRIVLVSVHWSATSSARKIRGRRTIIV